MYLKTPNAPGQRVFLRCAASFFLEIRQYSCEKMSCATQKSLAAGHIMSFQIHPKQEKRLREQRRLVPSRPFPTSLRRLPLWYAPPVTVQQICEQLRFNICGKNALRSKFAGQYGFALVLLTVVSQRCSCYRGKNPEKPKRFFWSAQGSSGGKSKSPRVSL